MHDSSDATHPPPTGTDISTIYVADGCCGTRTPSTGAMSLILLELSTRVTILTRTGRDGDGVTLAPVALDTDSLIDAFTVPSIPGAAAGASSPTD